MISVGPPTSPSDRKIYENLVAPVELDFDQGSSGQGRLTKVNRRPASRGPRMRAVTMGSDLSLNRGGESDRHISTPGRFGRPSVSDVPALLAQADHRIANHLALLAGYLRLKTNDLARSSEGPSRDTVHLLLEGVGAQIHALARLHHALAVDGQNGRVDLGEQLRGLCTPFASGLSGAVELIEDLPAGCAVRSDQILSITQIVAEVVMNALKHAHAEGEAGVVLVRCRRDNNGEVQVEVLDDGAGLPENFDTRTDGGLGFRLLRANSKLLGARIAFESTGQGLHFRLTVGAGLIGRRFSLMERLSAT